MKIPSKPPAASVSFGKSAEDLIRECQAVIASYLPPDSGITEHEAMNALLEILDGPDAQRFAAPEIRTRMFRPRPS